MNIIMSGLDHGKAGLEKREKLSFTKNAAGDMAKTLSHCEGVSGAVLLSTCNRTEVYLSSEGDCPDPGELLCRMSGCRYEDFEDAFVTRRGEDCARHLMEVSCGLRSQILGEDQILTQVKTAAALSRENGASDAYLETLFRTASQCGKAVKTELRLKGLSGSAADSAVKALERRFGSLDGKNALVIGNGEMGRLAASLLRSHGCSVTVTLRSYHHGETLVPAGCSVVPYDDRYEAMERSDIVLSATTSPHYTVAAARLAELKHKPSVLVDLAIPRDIEPETEKQCELYNIDSLGEHAGLDGETLERVNAMVSEHMERYRRWCNYRDCLPAIDELKEAVLERVRWHFEPNQDAEEASETAALRTVELLLGGLSDCLSPEKLHECARGIRARTR
jgi:glutamyl-tRNA reductase